jgi:hypothetical protein
MEVTSLVCPVRYQMTSVLGHHLAVTAGRNVVG